MKRGSQVASTFFLLAPGCVEPPKRKARTDKEGELAPWFQLRAMVNLLFGFGVAAKMTAFVMGNGVTVAQQTLDLLV